MLRAVAGSVLGPVARQLTGAQPRIVFYHRFGELSARRLTAPLFAQQLRYLRRHFNPLSLSDVVQAQATDKPLPPRTIVLTVDDGYQDFAEVAYPLLLQYQVPVTLYAVSRFASGELWLWFDRLRYVCEQAVSQKLTVEWSEGLISVNLQTPVQREQAWDLLSTRCLTLPTVARESLIATFARCAKVVIPAQAPALFAAMDWTTLRSLDPALIEIGAHTQTHPILSMCTDSELVTEITASKLEIESALQRSVVSFCYPNGRDCDFDERSVCAVRAAGFHSAVTSSGMLLPPGSDPFRLPRFGVDSHFGTFCNEVNGLTYLRQRWSGAIAAPKPGEIPGSRASLAMP